MQNSLEYTNRRGSTKSQSFASRERRSRIESTLLKSTNQFEKEACYKSKHFRIVHTKNPSERSYQGQLTMHAVYNGFVKLSYNFLWMFFIVTCHNTIYFINTYLIVFNPQSSYRILFKAVLTLCYIFMFIDFFIHVIHRLKHKHIDMAPYAPMKLYVIIPYFLMIVIPIGLKYFRDSIAIIETEVIISLMRCIVRTTQYFYIVTNSATSTNFVKLLSKYTLILYLIMQTFVCVWRYFCEYCDHEYTGRKIFTWYNHTIIKTFEYGLPFMSRLTPIPTIKKLAPLDYYIICIYYASGSITGGGYGGASFMNDREQIIIIIMSVISVILLNGCFQGAYAGIKFDRYRVYYQFLRKNTLIKKQLKKWNAPFHLERDIKLYYMKFLRQQLGQMEPLLFQHLPNAIKSEIYLDKYWFFFMKSYIFTHASEPMKRQIVNHMKTAIFNTGEIIYAVGENKSLIFFVAKGAVSILSSEDSESPLVCFGAGTCFGSFNIIHTSIARFEVRAATYCTIQYMFKRDFWQMMSGHCRCPSFSKALHTTVSKLIKKAKTNKEQQLRRRISPIKLSEIKEKMPKEENIWGETWNCNETTIYYRSKLVNMRLKDKVFIKTKWPWKFQLHSDLKKYWNTYVLVLVFLVGFFYPYALCYAESHNFFFILLQMSVTIIFPIDLLVDVLTVVEKGGEVLVSHKRIMDVKIKSWTFYFDIIAALPFSIIYWVSTVCTGWVINRKLLEITQLNCVFKCIKIPKFLIEIEKVYTGHVATLRFIKYLLYLSFLNYIITCLYYMMLCNYKCDEFTFIGLFWSKFKPMSKFFNVFYFILSLITHTDFLSIGTLKEMYIGLVISVIGMFIHNYILADIKATLELASHAKSKYCKHIDALMLKMEGRQSFKNTKKRVMEFLTFHWIYFKGVHEDVLFKDLSNTLLLELKILRFVKLMYKVPLFVHLEREVLNKLLIRIETIFVPPNELIVYEGQIIRDIFVIEKGSVEMFCLSSKNRMKVLRRGDSFCLPEMLMEKPSYFTYRSCTHCAIVKLSRKKIIKEVFSQYAGLKEQLDVIIAEIGETLPVKRLFKKSARLTNIEDVVAESERSWFVFSKHKRHPLFKDYYENMRNKFQKRVCRYLLMRRTITPNGRFLLTYEKINVLLRILINVYMPLSHYYRMYWQPIFYLTSILDVQAIIDMYLRLHVGYYNSKGILVAHPIYTASHYLKTSFIIDLFAMFPIEKIFDLDQRVFGGNKEDSWKFLCSFNRVFSLYRYNGLFFTKNVFSSMSLMGIIMYTTPLVLVTYNYLTAYCLYLSCTMVTSWNGTVIAPIEGKWLHSFGHYNERPVFSLHVNAAYWVSITMLNIAMPMVQLEKMGSEVLFNITCVLSGYFSHTFLMAWMSSQAKINKRLTENQIKGNDLKKFLLQHKIPRALKNEIFSYFELNWSRTQGVHAVSTIKLCHDALKEDFIIRVYRKILHKSPVFLSSGSGVSRVLGEHLNEQYFHKRSIIIEQNDVLSHLFILRRGIIELVDSSGKTIVHLTSGSILGHIDRCKYTRSMIKAVAITQVDLWTINTEFMYELLEEVEGIVQKLERHIMYQSLSYIQGIKDPDNPSIFDLDDDLSAQFKWFKWQKLIIAITCLRTEWVFTTLVYVSIYWLFYIMAFGHDNGRDLIIFYTFDAIFLMQIIRELIMSNNSNYGEKLDIRITMKNYLKKTFPHKIICIVPFEIIYFMIDINKPFVKDILMMNRCAKLITVREFFIRHYSNINLNVLLLNSVLIIAETTLFVHVAACLLYYIKCPITYCEQNWTTYITLNMKMEKVLKDVCNSKYICSIYYATSIFTHCGFPYWSPKSVIERVACFVVAFISRILLNVVVSQVHTVIKYFTIIRLNFDYNRRNLGSFLHCSHISEGLRRKVITYVEWLWVHMRGKQLPEFFSKMPSNLKIDCKMRIYGYHIYNHPCFMDCHADFLRQLVGQIQVEVYFAGNTICFQGEMNDKMYFIHSGIVVVLENNESENEIVTVDELWEGDTFGTVQGLFKCQPYNYTFKAKIRSTILTLTKQEWVHLLKFFPASKFSIYDNFVVNNDNK